MNILSWVTRNAGGMYEVNRRNAMGNVNAKCNLPCVLKEGRIGVGAVEKRGMKLHDSAIKLVYVDIGRHAMYTELFPFFEDL